MRRVLAFVFALPLLAAVPATVTTHRVSAVAETDPVGTMDDAADDPAIWRNAAEPEKSLIVGTDKRAGLHVYNLQGKALSFTPSPRLNNVDLRDGIMIGGKPQVLVAASDRANEAQASIALYTLDTVNGKLVPLPPAQAGAGEAYGLCLMKDARSGGLQVFSVMKDGRIDHYKLDLSSAAPNLSLVRSFKIETQSEGCVADDRTGIVYVGEEDAGIWSIDTKLGATAVLERFVTVDEMRLVADVEGLAIAPLGKDGGYLVASSQGDNSYVIFGLKKKEYIGRFRITAGNVDGTRETDGIELLTMPMGKDYPDGLLVVQDGDNAPSPQNFKTVSWRDVKRVLRLK
jgi:myo-inositol-hexaphosphate 3-phosphohydrolase